MANELNNIDIDPSEVSVDNITSFHEDAKDKILRKITSFNTEIEGQLNNIEQLSTNLEKRYLVGTTLPPPSQEKLGTVFYLML